MVHAKERHAEARARDEHVIHPSPTPGGCLLVFGATARPDNNTARGGVYVPHGCPRAVVEGARR